MSMNSTVKLPVSWHTGPEDSFHGKITADGPFTPDKGRYHLYIGLFCPFAHRANLVLHQKRLNEYAGIGVSVVRPYPKGSEGWRFNTHGTTPYEDATEEPFYGAKFLHELYFKVDPDYNGKYSVPVLWDKKRETIVNNESHELLRDLQTAFNSIIPERLANLTLYPEKHRPAIDRIEKWMQSDLNTGVYKAGFAPDQEVYEKNLPLSFAALNKLEKLAASTGGPYLLGKEMTELDIRAFATIIRFDTVYVQHFKCNLGTIRHDYPVLNNWLKNLYHNHPEFKETTNFRHIKENYTKAHVDINPKMITPVGPWPHVEDRYEEDWSKLRVGGVNMPEVLELEKELDV
jgi:putative glutathione S-transferase